MRPNSSFINLRDSTGNGYENLNILAFFKFLREKFHKIENRIITLIIGNRDMNMAIERNMNTNSPFVNQLKEN